MCHGLILVKVEGNMKNLCRIQVWGQTNYATEREMATM